MRIFTDINLSKERGNYQLRLVLQVLFYRKMSALAAGTIQCFVYRVSLPYEEILDGVTLPRSAPGERHELICERLHREMAVSVAASPPRNCSRREPKFRFRARRRYAPTSRW
jgi:hypothetical protein